MTAKQIAAEKSVEFIKDGMILGLGTGTTVYFFIQKLATLVKSGLNVTCVSTSKQTTKLADSLGIKITELNSVDKIDLTIDGADRIDKKLNGIKGGGGALLFEKIVANISKRNIWIIESSKYVDVLGGFPVPVEVSPFGSDHLLKKLKYMGLNPQRRKSENKIYLTDSGNQIFDLDLKKIDDPIKLENDLKMLPGVVEVGLFNNIVDLVILGSDTKTEIIERNK